MCVCMCVSVCVCLSTFSECAVLFFLLTEASPHFGSNQLTQSSKKRD